MPAITTAGKLKSVQNSYSNGWVAIRFVMEDGEWFTVQFALPAGCDTIEGMKPGFLYPINNADAMACACPADTVKNHEFGEGF